MDRWNGRVALVTGASTGIGAGLTRELVKYGVKVAACARNFQRLQDLKEDLKTEPGEVLPIQCDLRKEEDILAMFKIIKDKYGGVDICINNAGVGGRAPLMTSETEYWTEILEVNVLALCVCTRQALASMKERNVDDGHIIHISSTLAHQLMPGFHVSHFYSATKSMVNVLAEGIRRELNDIKSNIRITVINPGFTNTALMDRVLSEARSVESQASLLDGLVPAKMLDVTDVSAAVLFALASPEYVQVNEIVMRPSRQPW